MRDAERLALAEICLTEFYLLADQYGIEVARGMLGSYYYLLISTDPDRPL